MPLMDYTKRQGSLGLEQIAQGHAKASVELADLQRKLEDERDKRHAPEMSNRETFAELELIAERACHCPTAPESFDYCVVCMARDMLAGTPRGFDE